MHKKILCKASLLIALLTIFNIGKAQTTRPVSSYSDLTSAITAAADGDTIDIKTNIIATAVININKTLIFKGNHFFISVPVTGLTDAGIFSTSASTFKVFNTTGTSKTLTMIDLIIKGGYTSNGATIAISNSNTLKMYNCEVSNGRGSSGGGGGIYNAGNTYLYGCKVIRNSSQYGGGLLNTNTGKMFIEHSTFSENRSESTSGGGGAMENQGALYINNSTCSNNKSTEIGGAINNYSGTTYVINSTFTGNVAYGSYGGGAIGNNGGSIKLINALFAYNYKQTAGGVSNPTAYALDDIGYAGQSITTGSGVSLYYSILHSTITNTNATNVLGNIQYTGNADGSNNTLFTGGVYTKIQNGTGVEIGTAKVFQPFLIDNTVSAAQTLKPGGFASNSANRGCVTGFTNGNGTPIIGYLNKSTGVWSDLLGSGANNYIVYKDQELVHRDTSRTCGAIETPLDSIYMIKLKYSADGSADGASLYGDIYPNNTNITLTAIPNTGKSFTRWDYVDSIGGVGTMSTSNPITITLNRNIYLVPIFSTSAAGSFMVTYICNDNTYGSSPQAQYYTSGQTATIATRGNLVRDEFYFAGWNTSINGSGTDYSPGATYSTANNLTLYAKWIPYIKYYAKASNLSALNNVSNWSGTQDGTGGSPLNFGYDKEFIFQNSANSTTYYISENSTFQGKVTIPAGKQVIIQNAATVQIDGVINSSGSISSSDGTFILAGSDPQTLGGENNLYNLSVNNTSGISLNGNTLIKGNLNFINGKIFTATNKLLTLGAGATVTNATNQKFVAGPIAAKTNHINEIVLPIGKSTTYSPCKIQAQSTDTATFVAEFFNQSVPQSNFNTSLDSIFTQNYYDINRTSGTTDVKISLSYSFTEPVSNKNMLALAHYTGGEWKKEGTSFTVVGDSINGIVTSDNFVSSFSPFGIGFTAPGSGLPITLLSFTGKKSNDDNLIEWSTISEKNNRLFEVERSFDAINFKKIGELAGAGNASSKIDYSFVDYGASSLPYKIVYYRLNQVDFNGDNSTSKIIALNNSTKQIKLVTSYPNPFTNNVIVRFATDKHDIIKVKLINSLGQHILDVNHVSEIGENELKINTEQLPVGLYQMLLESNEEIITQKIRKE